MGFDRQALSLAPPAATFQTGYRLNGHQEKLKRPGRTWTLSSPARRFMARLAGPSRPIPAGGAKRLGPILMEHFYSIRAFHSLLRKAPRRAKIACFSGGGATKARPRFSAYGAAKCGVVRLVETIAEEEKDAALDINAVAPGAIPTRLTQEILALGATVVGETEFRAATKQSTDGGASLNRALDLLEWMLSEGSDGISGRLISAQWDPWRSLGQHAKALAESDIYMLRRILPEDRGARWGS